MAGVEEHWTVGRVAELAGVSVRTLHHYDRIGLVRPSARTPAGYRAYRAGDMERLREVLAYRRLGFGLREVADLVDDPSADALAHLRRLRGLLRERRDLADAMMAAIDREIAVRAEGVTVPPRSNWVCWEPGCTTRSAAPTWRPGVPSRGSPRRSGRRWGTPGRW